jgi:hypothetical protein
MAKNNEGKCCDAVLRILEEEHHATRVDVVRDTAAQRGVEVTCTIGSQHYAIEHTLIEPFPDTRQDDIQFTRVFDEGFENEVSDLLRPELAYTVSVDVYAFAGMNAKQMAVARGLLIAWFRATLPQLPAPSGHRQTWIDGDYPGVPVRVRLSGYRSKTLGGRLLPGRFAPAELAELRRTRLLKALGDKGPKLHAARRKGTRTVLVVKNADIALTNAGLVGELFQELSAQVPHMPDDIYMVDTGTGSHFYVSQIRHDGVICLKVGPKAGDWEFEAAALTEI